MSGGGARNQDWDETPAWYQESGTPPLPDTGRKGPNPIIVALAVLVAVAAVAGVGVTVIGTERDRPPPPDQLTLNGSGTAAADENGNEIDPLDNARSLEGVNIQPSDIGSEWRELKVLQGDSGLAPCYHPTRPFWTTTADQFVGYYSTAIRESSPATFVGGIVTVLGTRNEARRRVAGDGGPDFATCVARTDEDVFDAISAEEGLRYTPGRVDRVETGKIDTVAWRDVATFEIPEVGSVPLFIDHLIMARGRIRVGVIVASVVRPFDPARRDHLVGRMLERLERLAGTDLTTGD